MNNIQERLRMLRGDTSRRAFADKLGITESTLRNYEKGLSSPGYEFLIEIIKKLQINPSWLLTGQGAMYDTALMSGNEAKDSSWQAPRHISTESDFWKSAHWQQVPVMGLASCGIEGWYNPSPLAMRLPLTVDYPYSPELFAVIAVGTSMQPDGIRQGFVLFCDPVVQIESQDAVYIEQTDGTASIKKYLKTENDWIHLQSWLPPLENGDQTPHSEKLLRTVIKRMVCVVLVRRKA